MHLYGHGLVALSAGEREWLALFGGVSVAEVVTPAQIAAAMNPTATVENPAGPLRQLGELFIADLHGEAERLTYGGSA